MSNAVLSITSTPATHAVNTIITFSGTGTVAGTPITDSPDHLWTWLISDSSGKLVHSGTGTSIAYSFALVGTYSVHLTLTGPVTGATTIAFTVSHTSSNTMIIIVVAIVVGLAVLGAVIFVIAGFVYYRHHHHAVAELHPLIAHAIVHG